MSPEADLHGNPSTSGWVREAFEAEVAGGSGPAAVQGYAEIPRRLGRVAVATQAQEPRAAAQLAAMEQRLLRECESYMAGTGMAAAVREAEAAGQSLRSEIGSLEQALSEVDAEREQARARFARDEQELTAAWARLVEQAVSNGAAVAETKYK